MCTKTMEMANGIQWAMDKVKLKQTGIWMFLNIAAWDTPD